MHTGDTPSAAPAEGKAAEDTSPSAAPTEQSPSATRDYLANDRTLLAWTRTGIAVIGLGFVVARFGLLIRELAKVGVHGGALPSGASTAFGVALVICGALLLLVALLRYLRVAQAIRQNQVWWSATPGIALTAILMLAAVVLAVYLVLTA